MPGHKGLHSHKASKDTKENHNLNEFKPLRENSEGEIGTSL